VAEIAKIQTVLTDTELNQITSIEDAIQALGVTDPSGLSWDASPWTLLTDKDKLVGRAFLAVQWKFHQSKEYLGSEYVSVYVITQDSLNGETHFVINDGSTGIARQLRELTDNRVDAEHKTPYGGALVKGGLKLSEYDRTDEKGTVIGKGRTYYLSN
jgi:hypothetical protein